jgi:hypothetical protein
MWWHGEERGGCLVRVSNSSAILWKNRLAAWATVERRSTDGEFRLAWRNTKRKPMGFSLSSKSKDRLAARSSPSTQGGMERLLPITTIGVGVMCVDVLLLSIESRAEMFNHEQIEETGW